MRKLIWLAVILVLAGLAAAATKPGEAAVEAELKARFLERLADTNPSESGNGGDFALTLMCKADHDACYELVRAGLDLQYEDRTLYAAIGIEGFGRSVRCYGAFTRVFCNGEIPMGEG